MELYNYSMKILESETSTWEKQKNICLVIETKHYLFKTNKNIIRILKLNRHDPTRQNHGKTISLFKNKSKYIGEQKEGFGEEVGGGKASFLRRDPGKRLVAQICFKTSGGK